ncbi:Gfo/Idh/MocA family protein [Scatolibacter rhodanostii]|uniref:Gfo/Idh/MocA family protein n=1 Tax=Scatolibacter rhodanostii TaxID=2014781 RepID=UPI000C083452|nr:Gfo/Idh/MocA family oxidoreductase [Scatolibacter rhodanostii]
MLKVGMISKWHVHAEGYADTVLKTGLATITAVWDDNRERGEKWAEELKCSYYSDLDDFLSDTNVEAVVCDAPTTQHFEILKKAALAGKHIFTEKAMAPTVKECEELADIIEKAGITFTISLPQRTSQVARLAKKMIDDGKFGKISLVRIRNGHDGVSSHWLPEYWFEEKDTAGGALMDLGCHPMYMATWLLGKPTRISALLTQPLGSKVDESATASIEFENGAVCTGETSFVTFHTPGAVEVYGTDATLVAVGNDVKVYAKDLSDYVGSSGVTPNLPEEMPIPLVLFVKACVEGTGTPKDFSAREGVELTRLLENAYIANRENRIVTL